MHPPFDTALVTEFQRAVVWTLGFWLVTGMLGALVMASFDGAHGRGTKLVGDLAIAGIIGAALLGALNR